MKVLVTGGAGFIGSVTCKLLAEAGHDVIVVDDLSSGYKAALSPKSRFIQNDFSDVATFLKPSDAIDAVIHIAASVGARQSRKHPETFWQNNVAKTLALLKGMRYLRIPNLVFASSAAVYGQAAQVPFCEEQLPQPVTPYAETKLAAEQAIASESTTLGLAAASLRYFNASGAYGRYGDRRPRGRHFMARALIATEGFADSPVVLREGFATADRSRIRDYLHVADIARAFLQALERLQPGKHLLYNLGGDGFSDKEVLLAVEEVTGRPVPVVLRPSGAVHTPVALVSRQKAAKELGWRPEKMHLHDMLLDMQRYRAYY